MSNFLFFLYLLLAVIHLSFCLLNNRKMRAITKPLLMPLLLLFIIFSTKDPSALLIVAIFFGFLGDVFLLSDNNNKFFISGLLSFLIGHILYIFALYKKINMPTFENYIFIIILALILLLIIAYRSLYSYLKEFRIPVFAYSLVLVSMFFCSILYCLTTNTTKGFIALIGSLLFLISDYVLGRSIFIGKFKFKDFIVMFTYLSAQLLLVLSLI